MKVQMTGGPPWGFRMTGGHDFRLPLAIGKVTAGGKAARAGIAEGHHILTVNGEDVTQLAHLDAQNKIKAAKATLVLEISNAPVAKPAVPEIQTPAFTAPSYSQPAHKGPKKTSNVYTPANKPTATSHSKTVSLPSTMSVQPTRYSSHNKTTSFEEKNVTPDIEYRPVDSRDSQRRLYEELHDSEYSPTAHQSTLQSPSMQALARSSAYASSSEELKSIQITDEIRDLILEEESNDALRAPGTKVFEPQQKISNQSSPTPYSGVSSNDFVLPRSPPPTNYSNHSSGPNNSQPTRSKAVGNISKFIQSSGAKQGAPTFLKELQDLRCPIGDPAVLEIRTSNVLPLPTVAWYHNERPVRESREKDIKFLSRGIVHTLVLGEFAKDMSGRYRCVLTNRHGSASCSSILSVEYHGDGQTIVAPPSPGYRPASNYSYQPPADVNKQARASNSAGLYSQNVAREAYSAQTRRQSSKEAHDEVESAVMRALRAEGQVGDEKSQAQSRSMKMLEVNLMTESDDL